MFVLLPGELKLIRAISNIIMTDNNINISKLGCRSILRFREG